MSSLPSEPDRRQTDRRRHARGGRRTDDAEGYTPLIMVIDRDEHRLEVSEAILAKLRFAVAPMESVERALAVARALRPAAFVCPASDHRRLRESLTTDTPIVSIADENPATEAIVEAVRAALADDN